MHCIPKYEFRHDLPKFDESADGDYENCVSLDVYVIFLPFFKLFLIYYQKLHKSRNKIDFIPINILYSLIYRLSNKSTSI